MENITSKHKKKQKAIFFRLPEYSLHNIIRDYINENITTTASKTNKNPPQSALINLKRCNRQSNKFK